MEILSYDAFLLLLIFFDVRMKKIIQVSKNSETLAVFGGIPYGWNLVSKVTRYFEWILFLPIMGWLIYFGVKLMASMCCGWFFFGREYEKLKEDEGIEYLLLGQHFYELAPGEYSFSKKGLSGRADGIVRAELEGVESGYFSGIAHPDRSYRYLKPGEEADIGLVKELIAAASEYHIPLEKNISSMEANWYYPEIFWKYCTDDYLVGLDAHSVSEMMRRYHYSAFFDGVN